MAALLEAQLDFIFFFYGLAFILLGAVSFSIARESQNPSWAMLGLFGLVHGVGEWLDLAALVMGDGPAFATVRTAIMAGSFVFLIEFARQVSIQLGWRMPGRWIYAPLLLLVALSGVLGGLSTANVVSRYALGFTGAAGTAFVFAFCYQRGFTGKERWSTLGTTVGLAFYSIAAGVITPAAPFWPATVFNYEWFISSTGVPIQLVRGLLACFIAYSIWAIWQQKRISDVSSTRYARDVRRQFIGTFGAIATILLSGWALTEYLGEIYKKNVETDSRGELDLLSSRLASELRISDSIVELLAGDVSVKALFAEAKLNRDLHSLDMAVRASGAKSGYILDLRGTVLARSDGGEGVSSDASAISAFPYFDTSLAGHFFSFDAATGEMVYIASHPVRTGRGEIAGMAVLKKSLTDFGRDLTHYDRAFFLVDPIGVIVLTNRPKLMLRTLWPLSHATQLELKRQYGNLDDRPLMQHEVTNAAWTLVDGERNYVRRSFASHGRWSLVLLKPTEEIFASRVLGIAITLLTTILILVYFLGRERRLHDAVQMDKRLELQELASDLRFRAHTDPLTGLSNRLRFNEATALEMSRAQRYGTPLSLVLYDIDHFKTINDTYGHLAGDKVLIELSRFVGARIRVSDILARWGGEEFAILLPESDALEAAQFAEILRGSIADLNFGGVGSITCSFGIAQIQDRMTVDELVARADRALYRAKTNGRNRVEPDPQHPGTTSSAAAVA
ncbi:MAG: diguanylate cyclase [Tardiphaga sp.]